MIDFSELYTTGSSQLNLTNKGFQDRHVPVLIIFLQGHPFVNTLNLSSNNLGPAGIENLLKALVDIQSPVHTLNLSNNTLGEEGIKNFAIFNETITDVNLSNNQGGENCLEVFAKYNDTVTTVDFSSNSVKKQKDDGSWVIISVVGDKSLKDFSLLNKKVRNLTLNYNNITTAGVIEFSKHNKVVHNISLQGNGIDDKGAKALAFNRFIRTANLNSNRNITPIGKRALCETDPEVKAKFGVELGIIIEPVKIASLLHLTINRATKYLRKYDQKTEDSSLLPEIANKLNQP